MFAVSAEETITLAGECGFRPSLHADSESIQAADRDAGVSGSQLAFRRQ